MTTEQWQQMVAQLLSGGMNPQFGRGPTMDPRLQALSQVPGAMGGQPQMTGPLAQLGIGAQGMPNTGGLPSFGGR